MLSKDLVLEKLKEVIDPELGIDIVSLGLIRDIVLGVGDNGEESLKVIITLTTPMCPFADVIIEDIEYKLAEISYSNIEVELSFNPPWEPSDELRMVLGV